MMNFVLAIASMPFLAWGLFWCFMALIGSATFNGQPAHGMRAFYIRTAGFMIGMAGFAVSYLMFYFLGT